MPSPALDAALADIDTVFNGFAGSHGSGCLLCHAPEKTAYLRTPYTHVPLDVLQRYLFEVHDHFDDHTSAMRRLVPQAARAVADGALGMIGYGAHGLTRLDWRSRPAEQAAAIDASSRPGGRTAPRRPSRHTTSTTSSTPASRSPGP
jgi:hypothetical protein